MCQNRWRQARLCQNRWRQARLCGLTMRMARPRKHFPDMLSGRRDLLRLVFNGLLGEPKIKETLLWGTKKEIAAVLKDQAFSAFMQRDDQYAEWIEKVVLDAGWRDPKRKTKQKSQANLLADSITAKEAGTSLPYFRRVMRRQPLSQDCATAGLMCPECGAELLRGGSWLPDGLKKATDCFPTAVD